MRVMVVVGLMLGFSSLASAKPARLLDPAIEGWLPENRERINAMLTAHAEAPASKTKPVATFDWDNTMMRNDIGDMTMAWMLRHNKIRQPPRFNWRLTSSALNQAAIDSIYIVCDIAAKPGKLLDTAGHPKCASALWSIYEKGKTVYGGREAWTNQITLTTNEAYAWEARLLAGYTPAEARSFAEEAYAEASAAKIKAFAPLGEGVADSWVRIYDPMRDLVGALQVDGFDVWIVSASPQPFAEVVAKQVGIDAKHVIGVRAQLRGGRYTYDLESCGDASPNSLITFNQGKRCWINKVIFKAPRAQQRARGQRRQTFAAGDSDTDIAFVQDATELKLAIDRHHVQLMCNAYANAGNRWLVQPMFIEPYGKLSDPYPCHVELDAAGARLVDEDGKPIADQTPR